MHMRSKTPERSDLSPDQKHHEDEASDSTERRTNTRAPLSTPYRWEFRLNGGFFEGVVADLSEGGMFVNVANPQVKGLEIGFQVQFADGVELLSGKAEVAWSFDGGVRSHHAPGMGVRFLELDNDGLEVVRLTVQDRIRSLEPSPPKSQTSEPSPSPASYLFE